MRRGRLSGWESQWGALTCHRGPWWPRNPHLTTESAETAGNLNISTLILLKTADLCLFPHRSSHLPLFIQMSPRRSDWSHAGLKGVIPSALHYSLLGYNFFIPDAVGKDFFPSLLPVAVFALFFCFCSTFSGKRSTGFRVLYGHFKHFVPRIQF